MLYTLIIDLWYSITTDQNKFQHIINKYLKIYVESAVSVINDRLIEKKKLRTALSDIQKCRFKRFIERATQYNLKLNYDNCEIRQSQVWYKRQFISENQTQPKSVF